MRSESGTGPDSLASLYERHLAAGDLEDADHELVFLRRHGYFTEAVGPLATMNELARSIEREIEAGDAGKAQRLIEEFVGRAPLFRTKEVIGWRWSAKFAQLVETLCEEVLAYERAECREGLPGNVQSAISAIAEELKVRSGGASADVRVVSDCRELVNGMSRLFGRLDGDWSRDGGMRMMRARLGDLSCCASVLPRGHRLAECVESFFRVAWTDCVDGEVERRVRAGLLEGAMELVSEAKALPWFGGPLLDWDARLSEDSIRQYRTLMVNAQRLIAEGRVVLARAAAEEAVAQFPECREAVSVLQEIERLGAVGPEVEIGAADGPSSGRRTDGPGKVSEREFRTDWKKVVGVGVAAIAFLWIQQRGDGGMGSERHANVDVWTVLDSGVAYGGRQAGDGEAPMLAAEVADRGEVELRVREEDDCASDVGFLLRWVGGGDDRFAIPSVYEDACTQVATFESGGGGHVLIQVIGGSTGGTPYTLSARGRVLSQMP